MKSSSILLLTPPFTQLNTPYPATAYLKGFLNQYGVESYQSDIGIEVINNLFSKSGLSELFKRVNTLGIASENGQRIYALRNQYVATVDDVLSFLKGDNNMLAYAICHSQYLPEAGRFAQLEELDYAFGNMGMVDKARHLATLYLEDLSDFIVENIDPYFGFSRYAERLGRSAATFDVLHASLQENKTYVDELLLALLDEKLQKHQPQMVALSIPFPGNLYSGLRMAQYIKTHYPSITISMGGGFVNTELREIREARFFKFINYLLLDDGELPLLHLHEFLQGKRSIDQLTRTFYCNDHKVTYQQGELPGNVSQSEAGTPDYEGLLNNHYLAIVEVANPMFRLWSDGQWNKLTLAHGCYWGKCTFCDGSLDYIGRYEPNSVVTIVDRMEEVMGQTGINGFHFVDEAAPPILLKALALELLRRQLFVTWWTNIRFEKSFTPDVCRLLKASGCIAVSGGLEVASTRMLKLINKGVDIPQVSLVTQAFQDAGIMVHAYLMYGFPTQTAQETIDSLEVVRQLFDNGLLDSAFWHQFAMTAHSPVGLAPDKFSAEVVSVQKGSFANNDLIHLDKKGTNHERFGEGLKKAIYNYMHGVCFDYRADEWFDFKVPPTSIPPKYIAKCLKQRRFVLKENAQVVWLGLEPVLQNEVLQKKGRQKVQEVLVLMDKVQHQTIKVKANEGEWLLNVLKQSRPSDSEKLTLKMVKDEYESLGFGEFDAFIETELFAELTALGLLFL
jgi:hypothetical protein